MIDQPDTTQIEEGNKVHLRIHKYYPPLPDCPILMLSDQEKEARVKLFKNYLRYRLTNHSTAPLYSNPDDIQLMVDSYFDTLDPVTIDINKGGKSFTIKPYTITGLCLYLGYESRFSFYDVEKVNGYAHVIKTARQRIENHYENCLMMGAPAGPIFALKNMSWTDKTEQTINQTIREVKIIINDVNTNELIDKV